MTDDEVEAAARAFLDANGVKGVTIRGGGEDWIVAIGFAEHERFVTAYSKRNPGTPNDPLYLAQQALATLIRNERPKMRKALNTAREHGSPFAGAVAFEREPEQDGAHEAVAEPAGPIDAAFDPITVADIEDSRLLEFGEEMAEAEAQAEPSAPQGQDRFVGLDDLDRRRNLRIGDVSVKAVMLAPQMDNVRLAELRNFAMGVTEKRWADDPALREELDTLEATLRLAHAISAARDAKIAYLLAASREEVEAFDVEADWPVS